MPGPIRILIAAAFTLAASWRLGRMVMDRVRAPLSRMERELLSGICGASLLSFLVLICCVADIVRFGVLMAVGGNAIALSMAAPARPFSKATVAGHVRGAGEYRPRGTALRARSVGD